VRIKSKETKKKEEEEEEKKEEFSDCINGIDDSAIAKINSRCILNPANDFILCSVSFLSPCAAVMPNKSAYIHKDFFFFSSLFFFLYRPIISFLSHSPFAIPHRRKQITEKMRERETERRRVCQHITPHHAHIQKSYSALSFFL
jgi:hypothetical protein